MLVGAKSSRDSWSRCNFIFNFRRGIKSVYILN
jgi:hypothetical protein